MGILTTQGKRAVGVHFPIFFEGIHAVLDSFDPLIREIRGEKSLAELPTPSHVCEYDLCKETVRVNE